MWLDPSAQPASDVLLNLPPSFSLDDDGILRCQAFQSIPWLVHGFTTRSTNGWQQGMRVAALRQIHSARVLTPQSALQSGQLDCGEGDALTTAEPNLLLSVRTADCVPLLLVSAQHQVVAAVHAGWRGVVGGVIPATLEWLEEQFAVSPQAVQVAIGPCIREDAFEVGYEVASQFASLFPERNDLQAAANGAATRTHINLGLACLRQLQQSGVPVAQVFDCGLCTFRQASLCHSYRRDREASGRMHAFIGVRHGVS
jgi:polyphenol oxidase